MALNATHCSFRKVYKLRGSVFFWHVDVVVSHNNVFDEYTHHSQNMLVNSVKSPSKAVSFLVMFSADILSFPAHDNERYCQACW